MTDELSRGFCFRLLCLYDICQPAKTWDEKAELSPEGKNIVNKCLNEGKSVRYISELLEIPSSSIGSLKLRIQNRNSEENNPRSGRPPVVIERVYQIIERITKTNRRSCSSEIT